MSVPYEPVSREVPLGDPRTILAWVHAQDAAWMVRRAVEARLRGPLIGCAAGILCTALFHLTPSWSLLVCDLPFVAMAWRVLRRNRAGRARVSEPITVYAPMRGWLVVMMAFLIPASAIGGVAYYNLVVKHLDYRTVGLLMFASVLPFSLMCLARFAKLRFWEDLVFAAAVPVGWAGPIFGRQSQTMMGAAHIAPVFVLVAIFFLLKRYRHMGRVPGDAMSLKEGRA